MYRYYSTQRPVAPGTFPGKPVEIHNFDRRQDVPGVGPAWGYLEYEDPLDYPEAVNYELVRDDYSLHEPCEDLALWKRQYCDKNMKQRAAGQMIPVTFPDSEFFERISMAELEYITEMYRRTATKILAMNHPWCVVYAVRHHDQNGITGCDFPLRSFKNSEEYYEFMGDTGRDIVYTVYRRK